MLARMSRIVRAPEPPLVIPEVPLTPFLFDRAADRGDKPAYIDGTTGRTLTYRQWMAAVRQVASGLAARGLCKGDVVALYSPNLPEYSVAFHAVSLIGGVNTTINPLYTPGELGHQLQDAGAKYLFTVAPCLEKAELAARGTAIREIFVFGEAEGATPLTVLMETGTADPPSVAIDPREDLVVLPYSSGTTGLPKGVMLTHYNLVANILQTQCALRIDDRETMLGLIPFFHIYGMVVIMNLGLHGGATVVTMPRFEIEQFLQVLQTYEVTFAPIVPPIVLALAKHPAVDKYRLDEPAHHLFGRGSARRGHSERRQRAVELPGASGLWAHRSVSGHARRTRERRCHQCGEHRTAASQHRDQGGGPRNGRRSRPE